MVDSKQGDMLSISWITILHHRCSRSICCHLIVMREVRSGDDSEDYGNESDDYDSNDTEDCDDLSDNGYDLECFTFWCIMRALVT